MTRRTQKELFKIFQLVFPIGKEILGGLFLFAMMGGIIFLVMGVN
jgi:hypothetical protein